MPGENVDAVRRMMAAMSEGLESVMRVMDELLTEDFVHEPVRKFPDSTPTRGRAAFAEWFRRFEEGFSFEWSLRELTEIDEERILTHSVLRGEGGATGIALESDLFEAFWLRDGRIERVSDHVTRTGACRALGLDP